MNVRLMSYNEFREQLIKYPDGGRCCVGECKQPAYYEGGDARCWCPMCEEHAFIKESYLSYLIREKRKVETRMKWDKHDSTLEPILIRINSKIIQTMTE